MNFLRDLQDKITKLEKESLNIAQLDKKIIARIIDNKRKTTLDEVKIAINILDLNASKRKAIYHLYIYAEQTPPKVILNSLQSYRFHIITSQEIELKIHKDGDIGLSSLWNPVNRLTEYTEFKQRANLLIENLEAGKLDDHLNTTSGELLFEILGKKGKLLKHLGVDPEKSITQIYLNKQIQQVKRLFEIFNP